MNFLFDCFDYIGNFCDPVGCPSCPNPSANINLQSPNYPNDYGGPWDCEYLFEAAVGEKINLVFETPFVVENVYDYLMVRIPYSFPF